MTKIDVDQRASRTFRRAAQVIFEVWEEGWGNTRLLDDPLIPDAVTVVGLSRAGAERREHVVPLKLVYNRCEEMFSAGEDVQAVARMLARCVKIVRISKAERHRIDTELGLKTTMPDGWNFEDGDVFARLHKGGVVWDKSP